MIGIFLLATSKVILLLRLFILACVLLFLSPYVINHMDSFKQTTFAVKLLNAEKTLSAPMNKVIKEYLPTKIKNRDITPVIKILILLILMTYLKTLQWHLKYSGYYIQQKSLLRKLKKDQNIAKGSKMYSKLERKFDDIDKCKDKKESYKLLNDFITLKKKMESLSKYLAFLSVDIVDSTGIKTSEDKVNVQYDFLQYKKMVQEIFVRYSCINSAWTPDGVMCCFETVDDSVNAAQDILTGLEDFNENVKSIKRDFVVRCGINAGVVYYDEELPLEEMTDQVIDVAGHMQKYAEPGTIAISKPSIKPLDKKQGFESTDKNVDGFQVYQFSKETPPPQP